MKRLLSHNNIEALCLCLGGVLADYHWLDNKKPGKVFPIPRGGVPAAYALASQFNLDIVDDPKDADFFFDDIIDSGATMRKWRDNYPGTPFLALIDKTNEFCKYKDDWIVFPWEGENDSSITDNISRVLQFIGEDVEREGLHDTPKRVAKAFADWFSGYGREPAEVLKVFADGAEDYDQMIVVKDIPLYSKCEHHMADIFGTATIAYIPDGHIVGLSKLSRLTDIYARRLQVQERLTNQIASALQSNLDPKGVGVMIKARHMCMESRGICQQGHHTITTSLTGVFLNDSATRAEFMALAR